MPFDLRIILSASNPAHEHYRELNPNGRTDNSKVENRKEPLSATLQKPLCLLRRSGALEEVRTPDPLLRGIQRKTLSAATGVAYEEARHLSRP